MSLLRLRELYRFSSSRKFRRSRSWTSIRLLAVLAIFISILFSIRVVTNPLRASLTRKKVELPLPTRSPTRYRGSVPIVDREKYEEVEARMRYYAQYDGGDPNFEEWIAPPNPFSPPKVTGIPEPPRPATELWSDQKADSQFCPVHSGCRFLLPVWIGEQESKAIRHVEQLGLLAQKLNLTLVLPPMWKSRFSTCRPNPFTYYYECDVFAHHGIVSVTFEDFQQWTSRRFSKPSSRIYDILPWNDENKPRPQSGHTAISESVDHISKGKRQHCLRRRTPRLTFTSTAITIQATVPRWYLNRNDAAGLANDIIMILQREARNIIAVTWELRHPLFPVSAEFPIEYARQWTALAESVSSKISPFIAIHWRMETVPTHHMRACASSLVSTIKSIYHLSRHKSLADTTNSIAVYLATDYPLESSDAPAHSGTFRDLDEHHHAAVRYVVDAFSAGGELAALRLTSLAREVSANEDTYGIQFEDMDSGLRGILDKLIVIRSNWFVAGAKVCSRQSSFTEQIISSRSRHVNGGASDGEKLQNVVDYFSSEPLLKLI